MFANCLRTDTQGDFSAHSESRPRLTKGRAVDEASTNDKCHLEIASARSFQYQCVCKNSSKYSLWFKSYGQHSLFHNLDLGKASTNGK